VFPSEDTVVEMMPDPFPANTVGETTIDSPTTRPETIRWRRMVLREVIA
jgi:hypothetical protein